MVYSVFMRAYCVCVCVECTTTTNIAWACVFHRSVCLFVSVPFCYSKHFLRERVPKGESLGGRSCCFGRWDYLLLVFSQPLLSSCWTVAQRGGLEGECVRACVHLFLFVCTPILFWIISLDTQLVVICSVFLWCLFLLGRCVLHIFLHILLMRSTSIIFLFLVGGAKGLHVLKHHRIILLSE